MRPNETHANTFRLKDGRRLGYAEFGDPAGRPVFHFHGYPGSRLEGKLVDAVARKYRVRVVAVDRPGMGLSDFKAKRTILEWPDDVVELADHLKLSRFAVEGMSGGGPYSLACCRKIPGRLTCAGIVSSVCPHWDAGSPWEAMADVKSAEEFWLTFSKRLPEHDKRIIRDSSLRRLLAEELSEGFRQGAEGPVYEGRLYPENWGFVPEEISPKLKVYLWHGGLDVNVPVSMARELAAAVPNCEATFYPQEGHYSTALNHLDTILKALVSD